MGTGKAFGPFPFRISPFRISLFKFGMGFFLGGVLPGRARDTGVRHGPWGGSGRGSPIPESTDSIKVCYS